ncbi:MAG: aryl-sulfate sulfotransferase [Winogradskyella sp.]|uniref:aryl-sulfate sulfotransferase n=1 Tax=Winogradskyella sp. TaxID=1883156 RepID=UPI0025D7CCEC|nr:aryl-sulfate sulfotransferase [Winogradskyella sp.]NRB59243.1 aryl-sulfate sulfotransferase [Winogradskyella sp.]
MKKITLFLSLILISVSNSQETIGLVYNDVNIDKYEGYTLFKATSDDNVYLIDNCGEVLNQWTFTANNSRNTYLLENGNILLSSGLEAMIKDWDDNVLWSINYQSTFGWRIHHDIEPLPNGNFLVLVRDSYTNTEMYNYGMDTAYTNPTFVIERIIEIEPVGTDSANIVWEWKMIDHIVQDFDNTKPNFGDVSNHPELYNINYDNGNGSNPIHANAIDYNPVLDQIAVSCRHLSEVFVIDHSTTTAEAAGHTGGTYGKGGDFLWRWGNPEAYNQGTITDRKLGRQHDIKWITDGPNAGKMSVFCNDGYGSNMTASSVHIIDQNDTNGVYSMSNGKFLPNDYFWSWDGTIMTEVMHAGAQCGYQVLPNGNSLINESDIGRITEITNTGEIAWVYIIPVNDGAVFDQFATPTGNGSFRAHRYPVDYPAFDNVTFNNTGIIENQNVISDDCVVALSVDDRTLTSLTFYPNPTKDMLRFSTQVVLDEIKVFDMSGKLLLNALNVNDISLKTLTNGLYLVEVTSEDRSQVVKVIKE